MHNMSKAYPVYIPACTSMRPLWSPHVSLYIPYLSYNPSISPSVSAIYPLYTSFIYSLFKDGLMSLAYSRIVKLVASVLFEESEMTERSLFIWRCRPLRPLDCILWISWIFQISQMFCFVGDFHMFGARRNKKRRNKWTLRHGKCETRHENREIINAKWQMKHKERVVTNAAWEMQNMENEMKNKMRETKWTTKMRNEEW